jgi:hypothetical protein
VLIAPQMNHKLAMRDTSQHSTGFDMDYQSQSVVPLMARRQDQSIGQHVLQCRSRYLIGPYLK